MLESISNFIEGIANSFTAIIDFLTDFVEDSIYIIDVCGKAILFVPHLFGWLPVSVAALAIGIFAIVIIYKVLGREG